MPTFLVLLLAYTLSQFFRSFLAVIAPELGRELALGPAELGSISAVWFWAFALSQLGVGWALDRFGPRRTMSSLMLVAVAGALMFASAHSGLQCALGMALIGLGCSPIYMGSLFLFARLDGGKDFAALSSWLLGIGSLGNLLSSTPLAAASQWAGWRATFVGIAILTAAAAGLVAWRLRDPVRVEGAPGDGGLLEGLWRILSIRALLPFLPLTLFSYSVLLAERGLWVGPFFAEVHHLEPVARGNAVMVLAAAMSVGALAYGPSDRLGLPRKWVVLAGTMATGVLFLLLSAFGAVSLWTAVALLALAGAAGMTYVQLITHARQLFPEALLGRGITFMNLLYFGGAGLLQPLSGLWAEHMRSLGLPPATVFASLHAWFGALLLVSGCIYILAQSHPKPSR